jgi:hypothetical protein
VRKSELERLSNLFESTQPCCGEASIKIILDPSGSGDKDTHFSGICKQKFAHEHKENSVIRMNTHVGGMEHSEVTNTVPKLERNISSSRQNKALSKSDKTGYRTGD